MPRDGTLTPRGLIGSTLLATSVFVLSSARGTEVADLVTQAVIAKETFACQSPWQVLEHRECQKLPAGTDVDVVSGDEFFACVVWRGAQRCMWVARDALRKR